MNSALNPDFGILIVDDEPAWLRALSLTLESSAGITNVFLCEDSRKALPLLSKGNIGLVILDLTMVEHKAVYLGATGGAGALLSVRIKEARVIAYDDLGPEAIRELVVENFPVIVINDCRGGDQYAVPKLEEALGQA